MTYIRGGQVSEAGFVTTLKNFFENIFSIIIAFFRCLTDPNYKPPVRQQPLRPRSMGSSNDNGNGGNGGGTRRRFGANVRSLGPSCNTSS